MPAALNAATTSGVCSRSTWAQIFSSTPEGIGGYPFSAMFKVTSARRSDATCPDRRHDFRRVLAFDMGANLLFDARGDRRISILRDVQGDIRKAFGCHLPWLDFNDMRRWRRCPLPRRRIENTERETGEDTPRLFNHRALQSRAPF